MTVQCQIVHSDEGYQGFIVNESGVTVYQTPFVGCAEDADGLMEVVILRNGWEVRSWQWK